MQSVSHESSHRSVDKFAAELNRRMDERGTNLPPSRIAVLVSLGLRDHIAELLRELVLKGNVESDVVYALLLILAQWGHLGELSVRNMQSVCALEMNLPSETLKDLRSQLDSVVF